MQAPNKLVTTYLTNRWYTIVEMNKTSTNISQTRTGRKPVITEEVLKNLVLAFKCGHDNKTACELVDISESTFYTHMREDQNFAEEILAAKTHLKIIAATRICKALEDGNVRVAMWYLERKEPEAFGRKRVIKNNIR